MDKVLVPVKLTAAMRTRMAEIADGPLHSHDEYWAEMLDAAYAPTRLLADHDLVTPLRKVHADQITASVLSIIDRYLHDDRDSRKRCTRDLVEAFYKVGATIITDADRAEAGLSARGESGWTKQELVALEHRRLEHMLKPMPPMIVTKTLD